MADDGNGLRKLEHGEHCDCVLLAQALHVKPVSISFEYCRRVLQKHWRMSCQHGTPKAPPHVGSEQRWHDIGPVDSVKAILIGNKSTEAS